MSCFYAHRYGRRFPVPLLAVERFYELQEKTATEEALYYTCQECCGRENPSEDDMAYLLQRLIDLSQTSKKPESDASDPHAKPPQTLGTKYHDLINSLPTDRTLLWMTGYDYDRAYHLYSRVDRDDAMQMVGDFLRIHLEENRVGFENVLYGHGGSYKDDGDSGSSGDTVDLSKQGPDAVKAALKAAFGM